MTISEKIKTRRKQLNLSLRDIANKVGVANSTIYMWESGNTKTIKLEHINALARALKVDSMSLIFDDEPLALVSENSPFEKTLFELITKLPIEKQVELYNQLKEGKKICMEL